MRVLSKVSLGGSLQWRSTQRVMSHIYSTQQARRPFPSSRHSLVLYRIQGPDGISHRAHRAIYEVRIAFGTKEEKRKKIKRNVPCPSHATAEPLFLAGS